MSNLRWVYDNKALAATIMNGTGGGAPAREETSPFVMERGLQHDRLTPYMSAVTPTSPFFYDLDLGAAQSIEGVAVHGLEVFGSTVISTILVQSASSYLTFSTRATLTVGASKPRDPGAYFSAQSFRYWRFLIAFTTVGQFKFGRVALGPGVDLGIRQSGPYSNDPERYQVEGARTVGGHPTIHDLGVGRARRYSIPLRSMDETTRAKLEGLSDTVRSLTMFDQDDIVSEAIVTGSRVRQSRTWPTTTDGQVELETLA